MCVDARTHEFAWDEQGIVSTTFDDVEHFVFYNQRGDAAAFHHRRPSWPLTVSYTKTTPWGETTDNLGPLIGYQAAHGILQFPTPENDYRMGARTYSAILARFRQVDPQPGQDSLADTAYSYASNDPVNRIDPDGRKSTTCTTGKVGKPYRSTGHPSNEKVLQSKELWTCKGDATPMDFAYQIKLDLRRERNLNADNTFATTGWKKFHDNKKRCTSRKKKVCKMTLTVYSVSSTNEDERHIRCNAKYRTVAQTQWVSTAGWEDNIKESAWTSPMGSPCEQYGD